MSDAIPVKRALVSVYDKAGLADLAQGLADLGIEIVSTGSTAQAIRDAGIAVTDVSEVTAFPEILDGRVKTLHPAVHAGILADLDKPEHAAALDEHGFAAFQLVVVNLYPFAGQPGIEMIDVGGPTMLRAAAKNHAHVAVVTSPGDYDRLLEHLRAHGGMPAHARRALAAKAFAHTAAYDAAVSAWFHSDEDFPPALAQAWIRAQELRYGENPHQGAAFYTEAEAWGLGSARQLGGKELSYNNLLDTDAAWAAASDFGEPCVAIIKHTNPAGLAVAASLAEAYPKALAGDPVSAFGGIIAVNRTLDADTAKQIVEVFTEVVVAPAFDDEALEILRTKQNLRVLEIRRSQPPGRTLALRSVAGGLLAQDPDTEPQDPDTWTVPTEAQPDRATLAELGFAWQACKHAKSNAIVLAADRALVGVGAGQMSRVDSVRIAVEKSDGRAGGAVLASDAFFPFPDGPETAIDAGVRAIIQPGGSVRDEDIVALCDERGVPMVFTGRRHFRH
jgi:phosphoribosylaminoimidazolecarboxamide formyltransferase / IMP cyclohydrolase